MNQPTDPRLKKELQGLSDEDLRDFVRQEHDHFGQEEFPLALDLESAFSLACAVQFAICHMEAHAKAHTGLVVGEDIIKACRNFIEQVRKGATPAIAEAIRRSVQRDAFDQN